MENITNLDFKKTRAMNWLVAAIVLIGFVLVALRASSAIGLAIICLVMFVFAAPYVITAIILSSDDFYFFGVSFPLSTSKRDLLRKVAWYWNWVVLVFSALGVVKSITDQQPMVSFSFLIYLVPTLLNLMALRKLRSSLLT